MGRSHDRCCAGSDRCCSPARLQAQLSVLQEVMQVHLLSITQSELCVELRPRPPSADRTRELGPLRLSVSWSHDDHFKLQVPNGGW